MTTREEHIELYARLGWPVFEVIRTTGRVCGCHRGGACASPGKHPTYKGWQERATSDLRTLLEGLRFRPAMNLGLATGREDSAIVLDIDVKNDGDESLRQLTRRFGDLPETVQCLTGGGGWHFYFQDPGFVARNSASEIANGVDVRGVGGFVVLPPSGHHSGRTYEWDAGHHPADIPIAPAPTWLLDLIKTASERRSRPPIAEGPIISGQRNNALLRIGGAMRRVGASERAILGALAIENAERCLPPLEADEVIKIASSVARYAPGNSQPSEPEYVRRINFLARRASGEV